MENYMQYASIISACISAFALLFYIILYIISKFKKLLKKKDYVEQNDELKSELTEEEELNRLYEYIVPKAIKIAEANKLLTGETKNTIAKANIIQTCNEEGINYNKYSEKINTWIETLIGFSKAVNNEIKSSSISNKSTDSKTEESEEAKEDEEDDGKEIWING